MLWGGIQLSTHRRSQRGRGNRGVYWTDGGLGLDGYVKHFVLPVHSQHRYYGARRCRLRGRRRNPPNMPGSTLVHHNIVANNQHTNALQTHNSTLGSNKSAHRVKP